MANASFLPDDYLDQRAERRTNIISLVLFVVVMLGVFLAFLFTNQRWVKVRSEQQVINTRYQAAAAQIDKLMELEEQKQEMLQKADLAAALVERVPRSFLLAEMINRMPDRLSLLEFELESEKAKASIERRPGATGAERLTPKRAKTKAAAAGEKKKIRPPKYTVKVTLVGVAPTGQEVSRYLKELNDYELLHEVTLEYTEEKEVEGQIMQQFKILATLDPSADVRDIEPRIKPRDLDDPMSDRLRIRARRKAADSVATGQGE